MTLRRCIGARPLATRTQHDNERGPICQRIPGGAIPPITSLDGRWQEVRTAYLEAVVAGDTYQARGTAEAAVHGLDDMREFYLEVLQPVMVDIGRLWQRGEISVAQEHLATAIAGRVMASFYVRFMNRKPTKGAAVITAAPNEFHELGARMIADFLEIDGWDTAFLGADTPAEDLIQLLRGRKHELLGISVMMPFNLDKVGSLIAAIRAIPELAALKIMIGGGALNLMPGLKDALRADGFATNAATAVALANQWREDK
jgi:MerR family transcriptional regulator, light-induced transcriptional regulator